MYSFLVGKNDEYVAIPLYKQKIVTIAKNNKNSLSLRNL